MVSVLPDALTDTLLLDEVKLYFDKTPFVSVSFTMYLSPSHESSLTTAFLSVDAKLGILPCSCIPATIWLYAADTPPFAPFAQMLL